MNEAATGGSGEKSPPTLATLIEIWREVFRVSDIGPDDHFFELGGHSLFATQIAARAEALGLPLPLRGIFEHPRLRDLATFVDLHRQHKSPSDEAL